MTTNKASINMYITFLFFSAVTLCFIISCCKF